MTEYFEPLDHIRPIPQQRVVEKLDAYMSRRDFPGAERHLLYWLEEARLGGDLRGELTVRNELVGHYRKTGERDKAMSSGDAALKLVERLDLGNTISAGTTYVNVATMLSAFGESARALQLFEKARLLYEESTAADPRLLGGLYNNMGLCCAALSRYDEAMALYGQAMERMGQVAHGALEQAVTCLNMANLIENRDGMEAGEDRIYDLMERAVTLLDSADLPHDGYYAFVCEKCVPTLEYYGWFADAQRLADLAEEIYGWA